MKRRSKQVVKERHPNRYRQRLLSRGADAKPVSKKKRGSVEATTITLAPEPIAPVSTNRRVVHYVVLVVVTDGAPRNKVIVFQDRHGEFSLPQIKVEEFEPGDAAYRLRMAVEENFEVAFPRLALVFHKQLQDGGTQSVYAAVSYDGFLRFDQPISWFGRDYMLKEVVLSPVLWDRMWANHQRPLRVVTAAFAKTESFCTRNAAFLEWANRHGHEVVS